jgi:hypothetical protein
MADQNGSNGAQQPPKITVPNGNGKDETARIPASPHKPDTVTFRPPQSKTKTSRIELSDAEAPDAGAEAGDLSVSEVLRQSGKIPMVGKASTARIVMPGAPQITEPPPREEMAKDQTVRVDLTSILAGQKKATGPIPPAAGGKPGDIDRTTRIRIEEEPAEADRSTARISLGTETGRIPGETGPVATGETARISLGTETGRIPGETGPVAVGAAAVEDRSSTARISLPEVAPEAAPAKPAPPRTVRLQRPAAAPKTVVLPRPESEPATPRTVVMKKPEEAEPKGATSKISVPEGVLQQAPATQRKTIRIKRAEGPTTSRTIAIARPVRPTGITVPESQEAEIEKIMAETGGDEPGPAYAILALAATLVLCVLLYVLLAQTYLPNLPFPGKIA